MITFASSWLIEDGCIVELTKPRPRPVPIVRNRALVRALVELGSRTYCRIGRTPGAGVINWYSFRVLERAGLAARSINAYVAITESGRAALARCQTAVAISAPMEVSPP